MANVKISALTDATSVAAADELPIVQSGATKRATAAELYAYIESAIAAETDASSVAASDEFVIVVGGALKRATAAEMYAYIESTIAAETDASSVAASDELVVVTGGALKRATLAELVTSAQGTGSAVADVGFRGIPQNSQSANYTTVLADSGKCIYHPSTDANARNFTIDSNANVPYPVGTVISFCNMSANAVTIKITSDTMNLAGAGTTGDRTLAQYGVATAMKVTSTIWIISGTGLT